MILQPWHFSWTVSDLSRSVKFYTEALDFELIHSQEGKNAYTDKLVGIPNTHLKAAMLKLKCMPAGASGHVIELIEYVTPKGRKLDTTPNNICAAHMAFLTDDIQRDYQRLTAAGARFVSEPVAITAGMNEGGFTCYLKDPDDFTLEIMQPPAWRIENARGQNARPAG